MPFGERQKLIEKLNKENKWNLSKDNVFRHADGRRDIGLEYVTSYKIEKQMSEHEQLIAQLEDQVRELEKEIALQEKQAEMKELHQKQKLR